MPNALRSLERQIAQTLRTGAAGDDACAAPHYHLHPCGIVGLDRSHVLQVDQMRAVDSEKICLREMGFELGEANAYEIFLGWRANRYVVICTLRPFETR